MIQERELDLIDSSRDPPELVTFSIEAFYSQLEGIKRDTLLRDPHLAERIHQRQTANRAERDERQIRVKYTHSGDILVPMSKDPRYRNKIDDIVVDFLYSHVRGLEKVTSVILLTGRNRESASSHFYLLFNTAEDRKSYGEQDLSACKDPDLGKRFMTTGKISNITCEELGIKECCFSSKCDLSRDGWCMAHLKATRTFQKNNRDVGLPFEWRVKEQQERKRKRENSLKEMDAMRLKAAQALDNALPTDRVCPRFETGTCNRIGKGEVAHPLDPLGPTRIICKRMHRPIMHYPCAHGTLIQGHLWQCSFTSDSCPYLNHPG